MTKDKETIPVAAAIIRHKNAVLATKRGYGPYKGGWEFPGGKIEPGETPGQAVLREIREELAAEITVRELVGIIEYDYPDFHLKMHCFLCERKADDIVLKEHEAAIWLTEDTIDEVEWLPADRMIIPRVKLLMKSGRFEKEAAAVTGAERRQGESI